jgi:hypothetical protein
MKKILFPVLLLAALISCEKTGDLKYSETIPGGCALDKGASLKSTQAPGIDKVSCTISNGNLDIFVGFNATCCGQFSTASDIKGDSIFIKILTTQPGMCDCICYYTYNFKFTGTGENYKYKVTVDDYLTFTGKIKP